jgi:hypothetical protein
MLHPFRNSRLSNDGELLSLRTAAGSTVFSLFYRDDLYNADSGGHSLEFHQSPGPLRDEAPEDYYASLYFGGSPGYAADTAVAITYNSWKAGKFSPLQVSSPIAAMDADADRDGLSNFEEYACGTHPLVPQSPDIVNRMQYHPVGDILMFPANLEAVEAVRVIESSASLSGPWTVDGAWTFDDLYPFYHEPWLDNWKQVRVFLPVPGPNGAQHDPRLFHRLRIYKR